MSSHEFVAFKMRIKQFFLKVFSNSVQARKFQKFSATTLVVLKAKRIINFKTNNKISNNNNNIVIVIVKVTVMTIMCQCR